MIDPEYESSLVMGMTAVCFLTIFFHFGKVWGWIDGAVFALDYARSMRWLLW